MAPRQKTDVELAPELEAIATAADQRLRAQTEGNSQREAELHRSVGEAASRAIGTGVGLSAIADAERIGQARAREQLARDVLRGVERAARRKRDAEHEHERAVSRATRLGLPHRRVAAAAQVAHGTVRAILARAPEPSANSSPTSTTAAGIDTDPSSDDETAHSRPA